jgi:protoheme IX farnesyltransferase
MGWTAARNSIDGGAWVLFAILFCWQMPHFLSLAWMYRKDYARAGYKMLTVTDEEGTSTSRHIFWFTAALIPVSAVMTLFGSTGWMYLAGAVVLGAVFLAYGYVFRSLTRDSDLSDRPIQLAACARKMFFASLIYLPLLMVLMSIDKR